MLTPFVNCELLGIQSSSMVEHAAVNRVVVGSSPTFGAISKRVCANGLQKVGRATVSGFVSKAVLAKTIRHKAATIPLKPATPRVR